MAARSNQRHKERYAAVRAAWLSANLERARATAARYRALHKAQQSASSKEWCRRNSDRRAASTARRRKANPEKFRERLADYYRRKPERRQAAFQRYRGNKKNAPGSSVSAAEWSEILEYFGGRCAYCGTVAKLAMDHVDPLSKGGAHDPSNVVPACRTCNSSKHDKFLLAWLATRAKVRAILAAA